MSETSNYFDDTRRLSIYLGDTVDLSQSQPTGARDESTDKPVFDDTRRLSLYLGSTVEFSAAQSTADTTINNQ